MNRTHVLIIALCAGVIILCGSIVLLLRPKMSAISINGETFTVRVADNPVVQYRGLSGLTPETLHADGMAFVFSHAAERTFIMRDMKFPLDFIWVRDGLVVDVDQYIPVPKPGEEPQTVTSSPLVVDEVLEFPAGFVYAHGIVVGATVK